MSTRASLTRRIGHGIGTGTGFVCCTCVALLVLVCPASADTPPNATRPAGADGIGAVQAALTQLYIVPRPGVDVAANPSTTSEHSTPAPASRPAAGSPEAFPGPVVGVQPVPAFAPYYGSDRRLPDHTRRWTDYRYSGGNPSDMGLGRYRGYSDAGHESGGGYYGYGYSQGDYFRFGFLQGYDRGRFQATSDARAQSVTTNARIQRDRGLELFRQGRYREAADAFQLSSQSDQGDAIAHIYAGHMLFAVGRYRDAVVHLRRAFELQPRMVFLTYDMRADYGNPADYAAQLDALRHALQLSPDAPDRLFMLAYVYYYSGDRAQAYPILQRALTVSRNDALLARLLANAQPPDVEVDAARRSTITGAPSSR